MFPRQRQFSEIRSKNSSRLQSQCSQSISLSRFSILNQISTPQKQDCVSCINKNLMISRKQEVKRKKEQQDKEYLETLKKVNSMRDFQKQRRQKMLLEAAQFNKKVVAKQTQTLKNEKKHEQQRQAQQRQKKQKQLIENDQDYKKSRKQLQTKYKQQLESQLNLDRSRKQLQLSQSRIQSLSQVNSLKVLQANDLYVQSKKQQLKKCQQENKKQILEKSLSRHEERERNLKEDQLHMKTMQREFLKFTQFKPLQSTPYHTSRSILSSQNNPQDVFTQLKRIQTQKKLAKVTQRQRNNNQRMIQLKKQQEQNRLKMQNKISSMKSYVEDLTKQLLQKRQKQAEETHYNKFYQPQKSKVDSFTEESKKELSSCHSCEKVFEKKYLGGC